MPEKFGPEMKFTEEEWAQVQDILMKIESHGIDDYDHVISCHAKDLDKYYTALCLDVQILLKLFDSHEQKTCEYLEKL